METIAASSKKQRGVSRASLFVVCALFVVACNRHQDTVITRKVGEGTQEFSDQMNELVAEANTARKNGDAEAEEAKLRQIIASSPLALESKVQLADLLERTDRAEEARALYREVLRPPSGVSSTLQKDPLVFVKYAVLCESANSADEVQWALSEALKAGSSSIGRHTPTIDKNATAPNAMWTSAYLIAAYHYSARGETDRAVECAESAVAKSLGSGVAHFYLAYWLEESKDYERAAQEYKRAKALAPNDEVLVAECERRLPEVERLAKRRQ
jgi:tetratricopeptide (TPR) repeat protein